jgi:magnesium-transporting ATPase (P-type)
VRFGDGGKLGLIPFSSEIKFNCIIRDANPEVAEPNKKEDNITVFLKGAPDRVIQRCTKVLVRGEEIPIDARVRSFFDMANDKFAKSGERVLAFARINLDPQEYKKDPCY